MFRSLLELLSTAEVFLVPYLDLSMCSCNGHRESLETFVPPCILDHEQQGSPYQAVTGKIYRF